MNAPERKAAAPSRRVSPGVERSRAITPDRSALQALMLENEPPRLTPEIFRELLMSAVLSGASDITIQSDQQPRAEIHGLHYRITRKPWSPTEVNLVLSEVFGADNARTEINGMRVLDFSYELNLPSGTRQRFRVNATGIQGRDGQSVEITLRALPSVTPDLKMVSLDTETLAAMKPRNGIVVVAGGTGSGKSTTLAAVTRSHLEDTAHPVKIVDIQAPIEYTFRDVTGGLEGSSSMIGQSEVGRHIRSFADGVHSALRRKPNIINVGEARDFETIAAALEASLTGHLVYTTTHANDVSDTIRRLLAAFPAAEREARAFDLISAMRFCMVQYLIPRADRPGRVPVREFLEFTPQIKERLVRLSINDWPAAIAEEMAAPAVPGGGLRQSLRAVAAPLFAEGVISREAAFGLGVREADRA